MGRRCKCGVELNETNWMPSDRLSKPKHYRCSKCHNKKRRESYQVNKDKITKRQRDYCRKYILGQANGIKLHVVKRNYPEDECCENCGKKAKLDYHHWDNSNYMKGLWLCRVCHFIAEALDDLEVNSSKSSSYLILKKNIEEVSL